MTEQIVQALAIEMRSYIDARIAALPPGIAGDRGERGEKGEPGERGPEGASGRDGQSIQGPIGLPGEKGVDGRDGRDGRDGKDGKDSDITFAQLENAVADSVKTGFEAILKSIEIDGRVLKLAGIAIKYLPIPIYKGVFVRGTEYEHGDMVSFGGSIWHCNEASTEKPGDGSKSWTLAAKRGRDGKDK